MSCAAYLVAGRSALRAPEAAIHLMSFGFKHGAPTGVDYLVDARFLPNPYWQAELRMQTGRDKAVQDF